MIKAWLILLFLHEWARIVRRSQAIHSLVPKWQPVSIFRVAMASIIYAWKLNIPTKLAAISKTRAPLFKGSIAHIYWINHSSYPMDLSYLSSGKCYSTFAHLGPGPQIWTPWRHVTTYTTNECVTIFAVTLYDMLSNSQKLNVTAPQKL